MAARMSVDTSNFARGQRLQIEQVLAASQAAVRGQLSSFALATPYHLKELSKTAQPQQNHQPTANITLGGVGERASVPHEKG